MLSSSFTYSDMERILTYSNAPIVKTDQDILVCMIDSANHQAYAPVILHTGKRINPHCIKPLDLEKCQVIA